MSNHIRIPAHAGEHKQIVGLRPILEDLGAVDPHAARDALGGVLKQHGEVAIAQRLLAELGDDAMIFTEALGFQLPTFS